MIVIRPTGNVDLRLLVRGEQAPAAIRGRDRGGCVGCLCPVRRGW